VDGRFAPTTTDSILPAALGFAISELSHMLELDLPTLALALALGTDNGNDVTSFGVSTNVAEASWLLCSRMNLPFELSGRTGLIE
jgi:hypothetical protein